MSDLRLWHVEIHEDDWDYDEFVAAVVWAHTAEEAEHLMRQAPRHGKLSGVGDDYVDEQLWIKPNWRLSVRPAPLEGVALVHWHAG